MTGLVAGLLGVLGVAVGSFVNVVAWRLPRGESLSRPPSACPSCAHPIRPRDNVPVLGWLVLRGRCRDCALPISRRYPLVELAGGALFVALTLRVGVDPVLPAYLYLAGVGLALALIDIDTRRLPDRLTLPSYPVLVALLAVGLLGRGSPTDLLRAGLGGAAMFALYFLICFIAPRGMGFGDVKLSGLIGLATAWLGWQTWAAGLFLGFFTGGVFGVALIATRRGGRKTKVPFGPFMLLGALIGVLEGQDLVQGYLSLTAI